MRDLKVVKITASTPYERGLQYGEQAKELIKICVEHYKDRFLKQGDSWESVCNYAMSFVPTVIENMPELFEEAKGIAEGSSLTIEDIMVVNCRYEITKFPKISECTTAAVLPSASRDNKTYVIKNWDYSQYIMPHMVLLSVKTPDGFSMFGITEAGQMVRDGFNSNGIAIVNNNLQSVDDHPGTAIPVTFLRRNVLSCKNFDEAKNMILNAKRTVSSNVLIADCNGNALDFETYPNGADILEATNGILTHANHFVVKPERDALVDRPKNRDTRLYELLNRQNGDITVEYIMECMKDHEYYPLSICGHPNPQGDSYGRDRITVASLIFDFVENTVYVCDGPPCEGEYIPYKL